VVKLEGRERAAECPVDHEKYCSTARRRFAQGEAASLREAISADGPPPSKRLGPRVAAAIGEITTRLLESAVSNASALILSAIEKYYGWR
jgi:hypothetical protein